MGDHEITLTLNGSEHTLNVESNTLLVHAIRDHLRYTGTNIGCETSMCGACTVHMNGKVVKSCTVLAVRADGAEIQTVEGLANDDSLHTLQESFRETYGLQCGYCTPGMLMIAADFLSENQDPTEEEIRESLEGNLCRCTGYQSIVDAIARAAEALPEAPRGGED